ncbi:MAG: gentisate 1,2-dioxygenase [Pseudomonadota bacterium]
MALEQKPAETHERLAYYDKIGTANLSPLWVVFSDLVTPEPRSECRTAHWSYQHIRDWILEAGELITAKEAERRVLILENPGLRGQSKITTSLYAGLQLVLPGEIAPAHRHTQSALRFVLEGEGAHTSVDGERTHMSFGDFVITPPWAWHDHGNESDAPMVWLDGLDIPMASFFDTSFAERYERDEFEVTRPEGDSHARFGANMLPVDFRPEKMASPIFNYPYSRARETLDRLMRQQDFDPCHGVKMRYINPVDGKDAMPTITPCLQLLPTGFRSTPYRSTDATVFVATEGSGISRVGASEINWQSRDVFVVPSWCPVVHEVAEESVLFSFSDRTAQQKLGFWREQRMSETSA